MRMTYNDFNKNVVLENKISKLLNQNKIEFVSPKTPNKCHN